MRHNYTIDNVPVYPSEYEFAPSKVQDWIWDLYEIFRLNITKEYISKGLYKERELNPEDPDDLDACAVEMEIRGKAIYGVIDCIRNIVLAELEEEYTLF